MTWLAVHVAHLAAALGAVVVVFASVCVAARLDRVLERRRVAREVELVVAGAQAEYRAYVERRANAALLDDYASGHPMRRRPAVSPRSDSEINPRINGERL